MADSKTLINKEIESLRGELVELVNEKGSFNNEEVIQLSERLDRYIAKAQTFMEK